MVYEIIKKEILNFLKKQKKPVPCIEIARNVDVSYQTVLKHIIHLEKDKKIKVERPKEKLKLITYEK